VTATVTTESDKLETINAELDRAATPVDEILDDDSTVVDDAAEVDAEKANADLLKKVAKIVDGKPAKKETPGGDDDSAAEGEVKKPDGLIQELKDRATEAGIPEALAQRLHESGLLDEALAAFDRQAIERAEKGTTGTKPETKPKSKPAESTAKRDGGEVADVYGRFLDDPEEPFDERLVAVVRSLKDEIASLKNGSVQKWLDTEAAKLNPKLFGDEKNRKILREGYERICDARGVDPRDCNPDLLKRAYPAMFHDEVFKAAQRGIVNRLRGAEGRFIKPTRSSGAPPLRKGMTQEEADSKLMKEVDAILKR